MNGTIHITHITCTYDGSVNNSWLRKMRVTELELPDPTWTRSATKLSDPKVEIQGRDISISKSHAQNGGYFLCWILGFAGSNTVTKIFQYNLSNGPLLSPSQGVNFSSTIRIYQPPHFNGGSSKLLNECGMFFVILTDHYYVFLGVCSTGFLIREKFGFPEMLVSPCSSDSSYVLHS